MSETASSDQPVASRLMRPGFGTIAYHTLEGKTPTIVFLGGLMSDMTGTKALALDAHCRVNKRSFVRFDYTGHGQSDGAFEDGTIGDWHRDTLSVIDDLTTGPLILVGSSMGGWQMLLAALARPDRVAGLVGVAAAPDFTENLMWDTFDQKTRDLLMADGIVHVPSDYDDSSYPITRALIEDGRNQLVLRGPMAFDGPVRLLHGMVDADVPWQVSLQITECLRSTNVITTFIKDGDHRLSSAAQLTRLTAAVEEVAAYCE